MGCEQARVDLGNTKYTPLDLYDFPWSRSLLLCCVWATALAGIYYAVSRYRRGAIVIWLGVVSHWILDWISHGPDMPLYPGSAKYGLALWNSIWGTMTVEIAMYAIGVGLYVKATRARDWMGRWPFIAFVILNFFFYIADRFSPPPTNMITDVAWPGVIASAILLPWAWWFDRHRDTREMHGISAPAQVTARD